MKDFNLADFASVNFYENVDLSKTFQFDSYLYRGEDDLGTCCVVDSYDEEEAEISLTVVSNILKKSPENKVYLIAYTCLKCQNSSGGFKADLPKLADEILNEAKQVLSKNGIENSRVVTARGRTEAFKGVDIWFVPKGGEIPKPLLDYLPKKSRSEK